MPSRSRPRDVSAATASLAPCGTPPTAVSWTGPSSQSTASASSRPTIECSSMHPAAGQNVVRSARAHEEPRASRSDSAAARDATCSVTSGPQTKAGSSGAGLRVSIHSDSEESLRSDVGFRASYQWRIGSVQVEPFLKATWEHEFKYSTLPITAGFADISGPSATFLGPSEGHDSAVVDAGISVSWTPRISTYVSYNGLLGRDRYNSNGVSGGVRISF